MTRTLNGKPYSDTQLLRDYPTPNRSRLGKRNLAMSSWRYQQRLAAHQLALLVNSDWFDRAWQTPDMAMCLGRYDDHESMGDGTYRRGAPHDE